MRYRSFKHEKGIKKCIILSKELYIFYLICVIFPVHSDSRVHETIMYCFVLVICILCNYYFKSILDENLSEYIYTSRIRFFNIN